MSQDKLISRTPSLLVSQQTYSECTCNMTSCVDRGSINMWFTYCTIQLGLHWCGRFLQWLSMEQKTKPSAWNLLEISETCQTVRLCQWKMLAMQTIRRNRTNGIVFSTTSYWLFIQNSSNSITGSFLFSVLSTCALNRFLCLFLFTAYFLISQTN